MKALRFAFVGGRTRVLPTTPLVIPWEVSPDEYYHLEWYLFRDIIKPEYPAGWRPLKKSERPKKGDFIWWYSRLRDGWHWREIGDENEGFFLTRVITRNSPR